MIDLPAPASRLVGDRMQAACAAVAASPGITIRSLVHVVLAGLPRPDRSGSYKQASAVVERLIRDREVRRDASDRLYPWDRDRKIFAEALERAFFAAPAAALRAQMLALAEQAWERAGDSDRARLLGGLVTKV